MRILLIVVLLSLFLGAFVRVYFAPLIGIDGHKIYGELEGFSNDSSERVSP